MRETTETDNAIRGVHWFEQMESEFVQIGRIVGDYYVSLIGRGVPAPFAHDLAKNLQEAILQPLFPDMDPPDIIMR